MDLDASLALNISFGMPAEQDLAMTADRFDILGCPADACAVFGTRHPNSNSYSTTVERRGRHLQPDPRLMEHMGFVE